ncbi:hypothetical protein AaE_014543 [Aphanomyces astaci]|uniref:Elongator complex protein 4 n=2 Tax=Aphanomyces astaci TaxID=112090 RepID=A0A6A4YZS1_APHAT|nr:hypothetical protein AaE_014543 [Aphanomyces astaci]
MSSFRRAVGLDSAAPHVPSTTSSSTPARGVSRGVKPFINDQTLTSSGLRELDAVVGGGYLLGSIVVVESSVFGSFGSDLARYFAAEGLANEHVVYTDASVVASLPLELSTAQKQLKAALVVAQTSAAAPPLTIAWQYEKYAAETLPHNVKVTDNRFCHSFDLSKPMVDAMKRTCHVLLDSSSTLAYRSIFATMQQALEHSDDVVRFVLTDVGAPWISGDMTSEHQSQLLIFVRAVRGLLARHRRRAICMLTMPAFTLPTPLVRSIRHLADYVFELSSFAGQSDHLPSELADFGGLLFVHKVAHLHSITGHALDNVKLGVKRDRRKLKLEPLHLPPEGSRSQKPDKTQQPKDMSF